MAISLTTPGRLGFYVDYSELSAPGTHTFYICRTHGTAGAVGCSYVSGGDPHTNVSGTLSWADGQADIQSITVDVPSKSTNGDHRMWLKLSSPTGGAVLHLGADFTIAYGVIDDGTIAADSDAVFYDSAAAGGGTGTQSSPYNSIYTAISNVGSKRYLYGKGTTVPDGTNTAGPYSSTAYKSIHVPATRSSEATRLYIRNWPGNTWTIDGQDGINTFGFFGKNAESYHTFRGIDFINLYGDTFRPTAGIWYHDNGGSCKGINIEYCDGNGLESDDNPAVIGMYTAEGIKVWRCTSTDVVCYNNANNAHGLLCTYRGWHISIQRCTMSQSSHGFTQKQIPTQYNPSVSCRFCHFNGTNALYSRQGSGQEAHSYAIVQSNLFKNVSGATIAQGAIYLHPGTGTIGKKTAYISGNVFDTYTGGAGEVTVMMQRPEEVVLFNNIFYDCQSVWWQQYNDADADIEYADYNHDYSTAGTRYKVYGTSYATAALVCSAQSFECNNSGTTDPLFTNRATDDYTLQGTSPCKSNGVDGSDLGIYLSGIEVIGA